MGFALEEFVLAYTSFAYKDCDMPLDDCSLALTRTASKETVLTSVH